MKKIIFLIHIFILLSIFCALDTVFAETGAIKIKPPVIAFDNSVFKAGHITQGKEIQHTFTLFNKGKKPLLINRIKPG